MACIQDIEHSIQDAGKMLDNVWKILMTYEGLEETAEDGPFHLMLEGKAPLCLRLACLNQIRGLDYIRWEILDLKIIKVLSARKRSAYGSADVECECEPCGFHKSTKLIFRFDERENKISVFKMHMIMPGKEYIMQYANIDSAVTVNITDFQDTHPFILAIKEFNEPVEKFEATLKDLMARRDDVQENYLSRFTKAFDALPNINKRQKVDDQNDS